jgi:hypothetical protein
MPLWGNLDNPSGNQKPLFANTSNVSSNSTVHGTTANTVGNYGRVMGVSAAERQNSSLLNKSQHAGWVSQKIGTGGIATVTIVGAGTGINAAGFLSITDGSEYGQGTGANISYTIANSQNSLQASSTNPAWNAIATVTIANPGTGFSNVDAVSVLYTGANSTRPTFAITLGGRAGRIQYETLVAMGSISGDDPRDNAYFTGV